MPLDPVAERVHRAILRTWAETGRPPEPGDLDKVTAGSGRATRQVLDDLHEGDAIRLAPDGRIAVAYPFSAAPTRHRVRIGEATDVHAMCAIDALGISAMLDEDTRIDSVDATTGRDVTVTTVAGRATWHPSTAVVFIGADSGGGPSADCCCDYLNFFTDRSAAATWVAAHPEVPGEILDQAVAEDLGARLFGPLLPPTGVDDVGPRRTPPAGR